MATQKEKGHASEAPPKLQQLPGRSSNKLQGRLYSNAGRGYDRESLQKISAGGGRTLVTSQEKNQDPDQDQDKKQEKNAANREVAASNTEHLRENNRNSSITKYLSGALLFLAGVVVGNVVIPLFMASTSEVSNEIDSISSEISTITSITGKEEDSGCSITDITALGNESKGCSANAEGATNGSTSITNLRDLSSGNK